MIGALYAHSSGPIGMGEPGDYDNDSHLIRNLVNNKSIVSDPGFLQYIKE